MLQELKTCVEWIMDNINNANAQTQRISAVPVRERIHLIWTSHKPPNIAQRPQRNEERIHRKLRIDAISKGNNLFGIVHNA